MMRRPVAIPFVAFVATFYTSGCDDMTPPEPAPVYDYAAVCVDPRTQQRVGDDLCGTAADQVDNDVIVFAGSGNSWYYYGSGATGGTYVTPRSSTPGKSPAIARKGSVDTKGATIQRGGLGVGKSDSGRS